MEQMMNQMPLNNIMINSNDNNIIYNDKIRIKFKYDNEKKDKSVKEIECSSSDKFENIIKK